MRRYTIASKILASLYFTGLTAGPNSCFTSTLKFLLIVFRSATKNI